MAEIDKLFKIMIAQNASDMHLSSGSPPYLRIHGSMAKLDHPALDNKGVQSLLFEILSEKQKKQFVENWELDCSYAIKGLGRFRVNVFMQRRGMGAVFRVIPEKIMSAKELGLPENVLRLIDVPRGLVVVTGPTGSGKSTTLAALINTINEEKKEHILTIEDPIEFVHENKMSLINQREVSSHTKSFANALKAALREDPDIILVGEMRDLETIELAMTAAETGHLVFGTLHTNSAAKTVDRIIDVFPQGQQAQIRVMLAESLRGVIAQTLFPRADKPGRVAALEILINTHAVGNLIREGKTFQIPSAMQTGAEQGMMTFEKTITNLVNEGKVDPAAGANFLGKKLDKMKEEAATAGARAAAEAAEARTAKPHVPGKPAGAANKPAGVKPVIPKPAAGGAAKPAAAPTAPPKPASPPPAADGGIRFDKEPEKSSGGIGGFFKKKTGS
ncbi:MAG: type IV pilus twitching motility protein PilT [Bdellovibrionales bacterium]|nr:type IV pilus twitching motility protein PilT [Bdellovibrionales bacterium]